MKRMLLPLFSTLILAACGPGQLLGPTVTPTATATITPTITPSPTATLLPTATLTPTPAPVTLTDDEVISALLTLSDLRSGYTKDTGPEEVIPDMFAESNPRFADYIKSNSMRGFRVGFQQKAIGGAYVFSRIWVFESDGAAIQFLKDYSDLLAPISESVDEISSKSYGDQTLALLSTSKENGYTFDDYIISMRIRNLVAQILVNWRSGFGQINEVEEYAAKQETKLSTAARK